LIVLVLLSCCRLPIGGRVSKGVTPSTGARRQCHADWRRPPTCAPISRYRPDGGIQRRRVLHRRHAARPGPRAVHPPGTPLQQVLHAWPGYVAYVVSFLTIGGAWLVRTALTERLTRSDPIFLQINLVLLLVVAFLPFPARPGSSPTPRMMWAPSAWLSRSTADPAGDPPTGVRPGCVCPARAPVFAARRRRGIVRTAKSSGRRHRVRGCDPRRARPA
jgi:hypothetical protein